MISKVIAGDDFAGLKGYLVEDRKHDVIEPRGVPLDSYVAQMKMVARMSRRCTKPVKHVTFSAAIEDGRLSDEQWLELVEEATDEFGLSGHQRVIVRHSDKPYDHIHVFWCAVSGETGQTPRLQFRAKQAPFPELGPCALSTEQIARLKPSEIRRKSYDAHALLRLQHLCRGFEKRHQLRQLASPADAREAREAGRAPVRDRQQRHRVERVGNSLLDRAVEVRAALDGADWDRRSAKLADLGLGIRPFLAPTKNGPRMRGVVVYDLAKEENAVAASAFDTGTVKYGLAALDKRNDVTKPSFVEWWERRGPAPSPIEPRRTGPQIRYAEACDRHVADESRKASERASIEQRYALEEHELRFVLMTRRREQAQRLAAHQRRVFYAVYDETLRRPQLENLRDRRRADLMPLARRRMPSFAIWKGKMQNIVAAMIRGWNTTLTGEDGATASLHRTPTLASTPLLSKAWYDRSPLPGVRRLGDAVGATSARQAEVDLALLRRLNTRPVNKPFEQQVIIEHGFSERQGATSVGPIDGYFPDLMPGGVRYARRGERPAFVEREGRITVKIDSDGALRAALKLAVQRTGGPITVHADPVVLDRIRRIADTLGVGDRLIDGSAKPQAERGEAARQKSVSPPTIANPGAEATTPSPRTGDILQQAALEQMPSGLPTKARGPQAAAAEPGVNKRGSRAYRNDEAADLALRDALARRGNGREK